MQAKKGKSFLEKFNCHDKIPWHFPDIGQMVKIPWHFFKIPWQFPDLEKNFVFPWLFPDTWQPCQVSASWKLVFTSMKFQI